MPLRFTILQHDFPRVHWDLLIERTRDEPRVATWRLASSPDSELPIALELADDHRRMYLDYEGPVSGNRGQVVRWDSGEARWIDIDARVVFLSGQRLRGAFRLQDTFSRVDSDTMSLPASSSSPMSNEADVLAVLDRWATAIQAKDLDALSDCYCEQVRVYDIAAQLKGYEGLRGLWEACLPYFPNPIETHRKEMETHVTDELAVVTFFSRLTGMETDHPAARSWMRTTVCLSNTDAGWKIVHEHSSLPVDCMAEKPAYIFDDESPQPASS